MTIQRLTIENIQSHKHSELEFHPGVNVIVGTSDCGKTAIIRSLKLAAFNRPSGDGLRSNWGGRSSVAVLLADGNLITRVKDKREEYWLNDTEFRAFGSEVPKEIAETLNFSEINLQNQMDSSFLLSSTAGEVALHFNKIAKIDQIDKAITTINGKISKLKSDIEYTKNDVEKQKEDLLNYEFLEKFEIEVESLELLTKQVKSFKGNCSDLTVLLSNIEEVQESIEETKKVLALDKYVTEAIGLRNLCETSLISQGKLISLIKGIKLTETDIEERTALLGLQPEVEKLLKDIKVVETKKAEWNTFYRFIVNIKSTITDLKTTQILLQSNLDIFAKEMPDVCPLCGTNLLDNPYGDLEGMHKHFED